jgi:AraC-like DNA-binding protein
MELARLPSASLMPGDLPDEELFWHWRRSLMPMFDCLPLFDPRNPPASTRSRQYHVGEFLFVDAQFPRQRFVRDAAWKRRNDDADHMLIQVFLAGRNFGTNGRAGFVEEAGGVFAVNLGYETDAACSDAETLSLVLPRHWLADHLPKLRDASGALLPKDGMAARLFTDFMLSLRRNLPHATTDDAPLLSRSLVGLLGSLLARGDVEAVDARAGAVQALQRHIDGNLDDPELGADSLCARFRMSRATLFRLFKSHGGVQRYIQRRRLMACFRAISAPRHDDRLIYDIGLDYGFANPSHLSTLFRQHFGMTPSEVREATRFRRSRGLDAPVAAEAPNLPDAEIMRRWAHDLGASIPRPKPVDAAAGTDAPGGR